jgi:hypothetical protein
MGYVTCGYYSGLDDIRRRHLNDSRSVRSIFPLLLLLIIFLTPLVYALYNRSRLIAASCVALIIAEIVTVSIGLKLNRSYTNVSEGTEAMTASDSLVYFSSVFYLIVLRRTTHSPSTALARLLHNVLLLV